MRLETARVVSRGSDYQLQSLKGDILQKTAYYAVMQHSPADYRILAPRETLQGAGSPNSLENLITDPLPDGSVCYVIDQSDVFILEKNSTDPVSPPNLIATGKGSGFPGRWRRYEGPGAAAQYVDNIQQLRNLSTLPDLVPACYVISHTSNGIGGGHFYWDPSDASPDDNGAIVAVVGRPIGRWHRDVDDDLNPFWFGGVGDYNRTTGLGGLLDDAALQSSRQYGILNNRSLHIPDGNWKQTTPWLLSDGEDIICESFDKCIFHATCDKPLQIVTGTKFTVNIKRGAWLATGAQHTVAFDSLSMVKCKIDIAIGGPWVIGFATYREAPPLPRAGHGAMYSCDLSIHDFEWRPGVHSFAAPGKPGKPIYIYGEPIDCRIVIDCETPTDPNLAVQVENYIGSDPILDPDGIGHDVEVWGRVGGNGATHKPDIGVLVRGLKGVTTHVIYAEACGIAVQVENCYFIDIGRSVGDRVLIKGCFDGQVLPQSTHVDFVDCIGVDTHGGSFGVISGAAFTTNNVALVSRGHNFQSGTGNRYSKSGFTYKDGENLCLTGDFLAWGANGLPRGWTGLVGAGITVTKCGTGLVDTTRTVESPYCMRVKTDPTHATIGYLKLTGALGDQFLNTTVSVSVKVKTTSGLQSIMLTSVGGSSVGELMLTLDNTACENGFQLWTGQVVLTATELTGVYLRLNVYVGSDFYISAITTQFGVQCPRSFTPPRVSFDGTIERLPGGQIQVYTTSIPGATDPFFGAPFLEHDRAVAIGSSTDFGWYFSGGVWRKIIPDELSALVASIRAVDVSGKIAVLVVGEDLPISGSIASVPARIGTALPSAGTGTAVVGAIRNRRAAVFSVSASSQGYTMPSNCAEYWVVGRWDLGAVFAGLESLCGGAGTGPRLMGSTGSSNLINDCTITRDNVSSVAVDALTRIWRATDPATPDARHLGNYGPNQANNWVGPIGLGMAVTTLFTAEEADAIFNLIKAYYAK